MLGVAVRIAQRMGIQNESSYAKCNALEAEMRRRLWWSLTIFDNRISEMADYKSTILAPTWDCRIPLNVNDFDIRPETKNMPANHDRPTEALFAVVRCEMGDFVRHSAFHLDFTNPSLKHIAKSNQQGSISEDDELIALEKKMENEFRFCNLENPLHFMTIWSTRSYLAKNRLLEHYSKHSRSSTQQTDKQSDAALLHCLMMLDCDTQLMTSPLTKGYLWHVYLHFPFSAYIHIVQDLRRRPVQKHAERAWEVMSENYVARFKHIEENNGNPVFEVFYRMVSLAWEAREEVFRRSNKPLETPRIIRDLIRRNGQLTPNVETSNTDQPNGTMGMNFDDFSVPMPMDFGGYGQSYGMGGQGLGPGGYPDNSGQVPMNFEVNHLEWTTIDWNPMRARGW